MNRYDYPTYKRPDVPLRVPARPEKVAFKEAKEFAGKLKKHIVEVYHPSQLRDPFGSHGKEYHVSAWTTREVAKDLFEQLKADVKRRHNKFVMVSWPEIIPAFEDGYENYNGTMRVYWGIEHDHEGRARMPRFY